MMSGHQRCYRDGALQIFDIFSATLTKFRIIHQSSLVSRLSTVLPPSETKISSQGENLMVQRILEEIQKCSFTPCQKEKFQS